jgi:hypothetical protein
MGPMEIAEIALTEITARTARHNAGPAVTPATARTIRTETIVHTIRHHADRAASVAIVPRIIRMVAADPTILHSAVPVEFTTVLLLTTWAEIAAIRSPTMAIAVIRNLTLQVEVRSLRSAAVARRSRAIPHRRLRRALTPRRPRPAAALEAAEADPAEEAEFQGVPVEEAARAVAEAAVPGAAVHRMAATKRRI